jgi:hypothetical protein
MPKKAESAAVGEPEEDSARRREGPHLFAPIGAIDLNAPRHCAYGAYGLDAIGAMDFSTRTHCAYGAYGAGGGSMIEVGLPMKRRRPVRIEGLFRPFPFRGA